MISIIVAYAKGRVIGKNGSIPWHLPNDLQHFKRITSGHTIVMGRKTFESIGRPLPKRRNVVLTSSTTFAWPGVEVIHHVDDVFALANPGNIFIIGGENVYRQFLEVAECLYITEIALEVDGDAFFPEWDHQSFILISAQPGILNEQNTLPHTFFTYERKHPLHYQTDNTKKYSPLTAHADTNASHQARVRLLAPSHILQPGVLRRNHSQAEGLQSRQEALLAPPQTQTQRL
jgi:dihydrofolate reductase